MDYDKHQLFMESNGQYKKRMAEEHNKNYEGAKIAKAQLEEDKKHPVKAVGRKVLKMLGFGA